MEAKARGRDDHPRRPAVHPHVSAVADIHVPIRAGTDIAFLGGLVNHVLEQRPVTSASTSWPTPTPPTIVGEDFRDTEDLDGLFSGFDAEQPPLRPVDAGSTRARTPGAGGRAARPGRTPSTATGGPGGGDARRRTEAAAVGDGRLGRPAVHGKPRRDETLQHPRCVFQILKRHFARYTPEMVRGGLRHHRRSSSAQVADALTEQPRPGAHQRVRATRSAGPTTPSACRYIRTAAILQLLLGNIGRPGGGIMALRGHASIQGSTDIPTLFNILPGYLPMPHAAPAPRPRRVRRRGRGQARASGATCDAYTVSLLKACWGDAATADNDFCFDYLPRLTGDHSTYTPCSSRSRAGQGLLPGRREPGRRLGQRRRCSGSGWPTSTGWSSATCR